MIHEDHCNHSCTLGANHSCRKECNHCYYMPNNLAKTIETIRKAAGDSPAKAAEKIGISRQGYVKWELGDTNNMKLGNLLTFCDKYNVGIDEVLRGTVVIGAEALSRGELEQAPSRSNRIELAYKADPTTTTLTAAENTPQPISSDDQLILDGFKVADDGLRRAMLALARESLVVFETRNEQQI